MCGLRPSNLVRDADDDGGILQHWVMNDGTGDMSGSGIDEESAGRRAEAVSPRGRVVQWLVNAVASGSLKPGAEIPTVDEIAAKTGVARNTAASGVRDAERKGIVERRSPGARRRYVPVAPTSAHLSGTTVVVLAAPGRFKDNVIAPRWSEAYLAFELVPRLMAAGKHVTFLNDELLGAADLDALFRQPPAAMVITSSVCGSPVSLEALSRCGETGIVAVAYGNAPELRRFDRVFVDHRAGERALTEWLLARGCRRIAPMFPSEPTLYWMRERIAGYEEAMRGAGLEPLPCAVLGDSELEAQTSGARRFRFFKALAIGKILEMRRSGGLDGLVCANDEWAAVAAAAIRDMGLVPNRDILVAGYDNVTRNGQFDKLTDERPAVTMDKRNDLTAADMVSLLCARIDGRLAPEPQARTHSQKIVVCGPYGD